MRHKARCAFRYVTGAKNIACFILCASLSSSAFACIAAERAKPNKPELYRSIFSARVEHFQWVGSMLGVTDLTAPYRIRVSIIEVFHGMAPQDRSFEVGPGCALFVPEAGDAVVLFISAQERNGKYRTTPMRPSHFYLFRKSGKK